MTTPNPEATLVPVTTPKTVDDYYTQFEKEAKTAPELEAFIRQYMGADPEKLQNETLKQLLAAVRMHRRTTAGPPKAKGKAAAAPVDLGSLL